ncbi:MAG: ribbon-helix-helix domain-containing protein [Bacillota bacterium]|nr:ribbon-helix-helix domain-containing protein [Bacillota bacterium]
MRKNKNQRSVNLSIRVTEDEAAAIREKAKREGVPVSELIRELSLVDTDFISNKKRQEYFRGQMMVAMAFQNVRQTIRKQGYQIDLEDLERSIYQSCL